MTTIQPAVSSTKNHYVTGDTAHLRSDNLLKRYFQEHGVLGGLYALKDAFLAAGRLLPFSAQGLIPQGIRFALNLNVFPGVGRIADTTPPKTENTSFMSEFHKGTKQVALQNLKYASLLSSQTGRYEGLGRDAMLSSGNLHNYLKAEYNRGQTSEFIGDKSLAEKNQKNNDLRLTMNEVTSKSNEKLSLQWDWQPLIDCKTFHEKLYWQGAEEVQADLYKRLPDEITAKLKANHGVWHDPNTGNSIRLFVDKASVKTGKPVIVMRHAPLGGQMGPEQKKGATAQLTGFVPPSVEQTIAFGKMVRNALGDKYEVMSVGLCRGGMMAQAEALANGGKAVCFNSLPMGAGVRSRVGVLTNQGRARDQVTHIAIKNDWTTDKQALNKLAIGFEKLTGIGVPRNAGEGYRFPMANIFHEQWNKDEIHQLPLVSLCRFVAQDASKSDNQTSQKS